MSKSAMFAKAVTSLGHTPRIDSDGDIMFDVDGFTHVLYATEDDAEFMRMTIPNLIGEVADAQYWEVLRAVNAVNSKMKVAKAYLYERIVIISVENVLSSTDGVSEVLNQMLFYAHGAVNKFHEEFGTPGV